MGEALATLEGDPIAIDQAEAAFAAAMAAPAPDRPGMAAPARKTPEPAADPESAPHGWTWTDGEWRAKKAPGRPRTADKARVTEAPKTPSSRSDSRSGAAASKPSSSTSSSTDFTSVIKDVAETLWFGLATTPVPDQAFGYNLRGLRTRLRVQAAILEENLDALAGGVAMVAKHNRFVQRACERLATGEGGLWVLPAATMLAPFIAATGQLWSGRLAEENQLEQIAEATEANARVYLQQLLKAAPPAAPPAPAPE